MTEVCPCWKCGKPLVDLLMPLPRLAECPHCRVELHVCRMCVWYDPSVANQCREPVADPVTDKQRANFCGYFGINPNAWASPSGAVDQARRRLDALFGGDAARPDADTLNPEDVARKQLDDLFRK